MMKKRRRIRFPPKINDDTMSSIVIYSLLFCAAITIAGMVLGAFDHDVSAVVDSTHRVFGTELGICGLMKLYDKGVERAERWAEERRQRRMTAKQAEWEYKEELRENENEWSGKNHSSKFAYSEIHRNDYAYGGFFLFGGCRTYQRRTVSDNFLCCGGVLLWDTVPEGEGRCRK